MNPKLKLLAIEAEARGNLLQQTIQNYQAARFALDAQKKGVDELKRQVEVQRTELSEIMFLMNKEIETEQNKAKLSSPLNLPRA